MRASGIDPNTGRAVEIEIEDSDGGFFESMKTFDMSDESIRRMIDKLNVSADTKALLYTLSKTTIKVGEYIIKIGRKILDAVCHIFKEFPMVTFGTVFGGIVGTLISTIPLLGQVIGPIVTPILMAIGLVGGLILDFKDKVLERKIALKVAEFSPLAASNQP